MTRKRLDPFKMMRIILPEHREALLEYQKKKKLVIKPSVSQDVLVEWSFLIQESIQNKKTIHIHYWHPVQDDLGEYRQIQGFVSNIDRLNHRLKIISGNDGFEWISFDQIVRLDI